MSFRLQFSGVAKKVESKTIGDKPAISFSLCRKNFGKTEPPTFTWLNITIFSAPPWMSTKLVDGVFVAGSGEFTLRSYEKDGIKRQSADVRCQSFDVDIAGGGASDGDTAVLPPTQAAAVAREKAQAGGGSRAPDDEPPFMRLGEWW